MVKSVERRSRNGSQTIPPAECRYSNGGPSPAICTVMSSREPHTGTTRSVMFMSTTAFRRVDRLRQPGRPPSVVPVLVGPQALEVREHLLREEVDVLHREVVRHTAHLEH